MSDVSGDVTRIVVFWRGEDGMQRYTEYAPGEAVVWTRTGHYGLLDLTDEPDIGPPAPGEGDDLPNPEVGMRC